MFADPLLPPNTASLAYPHAVAMPPASLYNNIKAPSQLQPSATYYLFKENIDPKWEHPKNAQGGCWTANVPSTFTSNNPPEEYRR